MARLATLLVLIVGGTISADELKYPHLTILACWLVNLITILLWL